VIVGGYSLHLYCDDKKHDPLITQIQNHQFSGPTKMAATQEARAAGWKLYETQDVAICPHCSKTHYGRK